MAATKQQPDRNSLGEPKLRICMLAACPFPANHGTPGSIREMAEGLAERGHDIHIVSYHMGQDIPLDGPQLHRIPQWTKETGVVVGPTIRRPLYDLQMVFKTVEVVRKFDCDLIHAHGYEAALAAWLARLVTWRPFVYSAHNTMGDELASYGRIRPRFIADAMAWGLDAVVPCLGNRCIPHSANIEEFLRNKGLGKRTESVVYKGIDVRGASDEGNGEIVRNRHSLGNAPVLLYTGVIDEFQRMDLLLEATVQVVAKNPDVKLVVATTIHHEGNLQRFEKDVARLNLQDHVIITEPQPLESVRDYLKACDVAVVPRPKAPGFPIKVLNILAAKKPCVMFASSSGGLEHRSNAYLVPEDTSDALAEGLLEVLGDRDLQVDLGEAGFEYALNNRDRSVTARRVSTAYMRTLENSRRARDFDKRPRVGQATLTSRSDPEDEQQEGTKEAALTTTV